jgi:hypothetical protein
LYCKQRDKRTSLPTGVQPVFSYANPGHFKTTDQIVPIPSSRIEELLEENYAEINQMFTHTPMFFS